MADNKELVEAKQLWEKAEGERDEAEERSKRDDKEKQLREKVEREHNEAEERSKREHNKEKQLREKAERERDEEKQLREKAERERNEAEERSKRERNEEKQRREKAEQLWEKAERERNEAQERSKRERDEEKQRHDNEIEQLKQLREKAERERDEEKQLREKAEQERNEAEERSKRDHNKQEKRNDPRTPKPKTISDKLAAEDTPFRANSASQTGSEQTHDDVDSRILEELEGRVYCNVQGFYERYFEGNPWTDCGKDIYKKASTQYTGGRWDGLPNPPCQHEFISWFDNLQSIIFQGYHRKYYNSPNLALRGSEADRKLDMFLAVDNATLVNKKYHWSEVLVVGELKKNPSKDNSQEVLKGIAGYVREVFGSQPDRRFVPAFSICGSKMRLWMFDRSGAYNSESFDMHKAPKRFIKVVAGYALMTEAELGLNTFIKYDMTKQKYINIQDVKGINLRINLEKEPIATTNAIVSRGTTCYRGKEPGTVDWKYVVKFCWPSFLRQEEGCLLKSATENNVINIAQWIHHEFVHIDNHEDTISYFRRGMEFGQPRKARKASSKSVSKSASKGLSSNQNSNGDAAGSMSTSNMAAAFRLKRKTDQLPSKKDGRKRRKLNSSYTSETNITKDGAHTRKVREPVSDSLAHGRNDWTAQRQESNANRMIAESKTYDDRRHYCLVTSPAGRPLREYKSAKELLQVLRDSIQGHRSLLESGKILHRDISINNIIILDGTTEEDSKGMLIDLDLAKKLKSMPSGARHRTGTMQFMAIEVLEGRGHTYRHDLESFFYVFLWICIRYGDEKTGQESKENLKESLLNKWYTGPYSDIADAKRLHMGKLYFEAITTEFATNFKNLEPLAHELRSILFPSVEGGIFAGTYDESDSLYDGMINAFTKAINGLSNKD